MKDIGTEKTDPGSPSDVKELINLISEDQRILIGLSDYYERKFDKNDILVRITHCGIARGDIQIIDDDWVIPNSPWFRVMKLLA